MMRAIFLGILFCSVLASLQAQLPSLFVNDNVDRLLWEQSFKKPDFSYHTALRSYDRVMMLDSTQLKTPAFMRHDLQPLMDLNSSAYYDDSVTFHSRSVLGLGYSSSYGERWDVDLALFGGIETEPLFSELHTGTAEISEGYGKAQGDQQQLSFWDINGRLRFQASKEFRIEVGKAKNFLGDGYRSFFLSDNAAAYPYLRIDTKVWHIQYVNLFSWQQGMFDPYGPSNTFENKFTSTHLLSWNVSEVFNVHLFETIIWQGQDTLSNRGFDVQYLNPIIFYRPVEFASGSSDNAILGLGSSVRIWPQYEWYMQLALDEFLLSELTNGTGWWGNKFGVQTGLKGKDLFGQKGLFMQGEVNIARPFIYSHGSPLQSYTHYNQALAHPLGANFREYLLIAAYDWDQWQVRGFFSFSQNGMDELGRNLGGDIFRSYRDPYQTFNNVIGQGTRVDTYRADLNFSWILDPERDTRIQLGYGYRQYNGDVRNNSIHSIQLSIRSSMGDGYR